ncbi:MAG: SAM-dependent methyltransferase [Phycisphaerae bacterium]|nr:SAM-dependent methyltransferase [Phycisphaerae bacterium]
MKPEIQPADLAAALGPLELEAGELAALHARLTTPSRSAVRLNPLGQAVSVDAVPFAREPVPWFDGPAFWCEAGVRAAAHPLFAAGAYWVQDAGSLLAVALLDPRPGELVCDLCASPGGKATAILERLGDDGFLLANEVVRSRLGPLVLNLARHGSTRWTVTQRDPAALAEAVGPVFDAVLVDAPCTGQSLVARGKQTARAFDPKQIAHSAARQQRILDAAVRLLRPGGRLVYSTCTFAWAENEAQVAGLQQRCPTVRSDPLVALAPYAVGGGTPLGCYRLWPHRHDCAGAFAAHLVADDAVGDPPRTRSSPRLTRPTAAMRQALGEWGELTNAIRLDVRQERLFGWSPGVPDRWQAIAEAGPEIAHCRGRTWFPSYALAMRRDGAFVPHRTRALSATDVPRYLTGTDVAVDAVGWTVVTVGELPLGWTKADGRTGKNQLPKSARLTL